MDLENLLGNAGLDDRESKVYLALLQLGDASVADVAERAGFQRPNCYDILDGLVEKGIVSFYFKNKWRRYTAEDPQVLIKMLQERTAMLSAALPDLRSVFNRAPHKPKVRYFEGKEGIKQIYEQALKSKAYDNIYNQDLVVPVYGDYIFEFGEQVVAKGIKAREIVVTAAHPLPQHRHFHKPLQEVRYLPPSAKVSTDLLIFENKVALVSYAGDLHAVIIESQGIVETQATMFEFMWNAAK